MRLFLFLFLHNFIICKKGIFPTFLPLFGTPVFILNKPPFFKNAARK
jgi:hypothetical protein